MKTLTRSTKHQTRFPAGTPERELSVNVVVTLPEPTGSDLGLSFECDPPLDQDVEDTIFARTRSQLLRTLAECGGIPEGGVAVSVALEIPGELVAQVQGGLASLVAFVSAENLHTALAAPRAAPVAER